MGQDNWSYLTDGLDVATVARGVTAGIKPMPPGGGDFLFAFNSLAVVKGAVGLFVNEPDFAPMEKGGSIRGCIQRGPGGGATGFSPFLYLCCHGPSVNDEAYLLGLADEDPYHIVLKKGRLVYGIADSEGLGVLLASAESHSQGTWHHLRLDVIVNENGDVVLHAFSNALSDHPLDTPPDWQPILGMEEFIDDHLGINSRSQPLVSGRGGFGMQVADVTRRAYFDHLEVLRQV